MTKLITNLKEREEAGIMPPKFVFPRAIESSSNILKGKPFENAREKSTLLEDFSSKLENLDISKEEKEALIGAAEKAMLASIRPAYKKLTAFLEVQSERATTDHGAWKFPNAKPIITMHWHEPPRPI